MSRSTRLLIGVLLILSVIGVMGVALLNEDDPRTFQNSCVIAALLMVTGLFVVITTLRVKLPPRVRGRAGMRLSPKRLVGGLGAVVGCIVVWLVSMSVLGVSKRGVLMLPVLGVPVGLLTAASAWAVACTRCSRRFDLEQLHTAEHVQVTCRVRPPRRGVRLVSGRGRRDGDSGVSGTGRHSNG